MLRGIFGSGGGAPVGGSGTSSPSTIPRWTGATTLGDSVITQSGTFIGINRAVPTAAIQLGAFSSPVAPTYSTTNGDGLLVNAYYDGGPNFARHVHIVASTADTTPADISFFVKATSANPVRAAIIDPNGNVGIGTASAASTISANSTVLAVAAPGGNLGTVRVSNTSNFSGNHAEFFASTLAVGLWGSSNCPFLFYTNNVERMRISASGTQAQSQVAIGTSSFTSGCSLTVTQSIDASQSGQGLKLPATPGNADTQTLDAYQENTWTPTLSAAATWGGTAPTVTRAVYTRVGRIVFCEVILAATGGVAYSSTWASTTITSPFAAAGYVPVTCINGNAVGAIGAQANSTTVYLPTLGAVTSDLRISWQYTV